MKTCGIHFCYKNHSVRPFEPANIHLNTFHNTSTVQIAQNHWMSNSFQTYVAILMSYGMKTLKFKILCYKYKDCYRAENLQNIYLGCSITKESPKLRGSAILHFKNIDDVS